LTFVVACVRDLVNGTVKREMRSFKTSRQPPRDCWRCRTGSWHILSDADFYLVLANAAHVKDLLGRKTDVSDATWPADLLAHGLIRGSFVPDQQTQEMRDLLRIRKQLVRGAQPPCPAPAEDARRCKYKFASDPCARWCGRGWHREVSPHPDQSPLCAFLQCPDPVAAARLSLF
jgi:Transposase